ncbi:MAG: hypothetical protein AVDCRST_MAG88-2076, partial [uncultured Thermomicrobiales bacterium]
MSTSVTESGATGNQPSESIITATGAAYAAGRPGGRRRRSSGLPPWQEAPHPVMQALKGLVLFLIAFTMIFPIVYVIAVSFSSARDVTAGGLILFPKNPTLEAYQSILRGGIVVRALWVSIGVTLGGTLVNIIMTTLLAYGLSRPGVPGRRFVLALVLFTLLFGPGLI